MESESEFATCECGSTVFEVSSHRIMCIECGAGTDVKEVDLLKMIRAANEERFEAYRLVP